MTRPSVSALKVAARPDGDAYGVVRPLREIYAAGRLRLRFPISANPIEALRFAAFAARLAERRSAEEIALRSPYRRDEAIAPRGRLVPDKRRLLLLVRQPGQSQHPSKASLYEAFPAGAESSGIFNAFAGYGRLSEAGNI